MRSPCCAVAELDNSSSKTSVAQLISDEWGYSLFDLPIATHNYKLYRRFNRALFALAGTKLWFAVGCREPRYRPIRGSVIVPHSLFRSLVTADRQVGDTERSHQYVVCTQGLRTPARIAAARSMVAMASSKSAAGVPNARCSFIQSKK